MMQSPENRSWLRQREQAKIGMSVALGTLVATGFLAHMSVKDRAGGARLVHVAAGISLVGFSYWHWTLHQRTGSGKGHRS